MRKRLKKNLIKIFVCIFVISIFFMLFINIKAVNFFKTIEEPKEENSDDINILKKGDLFNTPTEDRFYISEEKYLISSSKIGSDNNFETAIPLIFRKSDGKLVFSTQENINFPDINKIYLRAKEEKKDENIDYDSSGELRNLNKILSKDLNNLNDLSRETKNSLGYILSKMYLYEENQEKINIKKASLLSEVFGNEKEILDSDIYIAFQLSIWDIIDKKNRDFSKVEIIKSDSEKISLERSRRKNIEKIYKYLMEIGEKNREFSNKYKRINLNYEGEKEKTLDGTVLKNIKISANEIMKKNIVDLNITTYLNSTKQNILLPKNKIYLLKDREVLKDKDIISEIKKGLEENTYKETSFDFFIDKEITKEEDLSKICIILKYIYDENIPVVYESEDEENTSIISIYKNNNKYISKVDIVDKEKDLRIFSNIESINNIKISGRNLDSSNIDPSKLRNYINPLGTNTNFKTDLKRERLEVLPNDNIVFNIKVFNEGDINAIAGTVLAYIPEGLNVDLNDELNKRFSWKKLSENIYYSDYLKNFEIKEAQRAGNSSEEKIMKIDSKELKLKCFLESDINNMSAIDIYFKLANAFFKNDESDNLNIEDIVENLDDDKRNEGKAKNEILNFFKNEDRDSKFLNENEYINAFNITKIDDSFSKEEIIVNEKSDLALKIVATHINDEKIENRDFDPLKDIEVLENAVKYNLNKEEISVKEGQKIRFKIYIFNEGNIDEILNSVAICLPDFAFLDKNSNINQKEGWKENENYIYLNNLDINIKKRISENNKIYLAKHEIELEININSFNKILKKEDFKVFAEIKKQGRNDTDSSPDTFDFNKKGAYKNLEEYIEKKHLEDDTDYESFKILKEEKDLALRIRAIKKGEEEIENRKNYISNIILDDLKYNKDTNAKYRCPKNEINVKLNERILFEISVFNEGKENTNGKKIRAYIPEGMEFLNLDQSVINDKYNWRYVGDSGRIIETDYLVEKEIKGIDNKKDENNISREIVELELITKESMTEDKENIVLAEIAESKIGDRDSVGANINFEYLLNNPDEFFKKYFFNIEDMDLSENEYFKANEDDDDFEILIYRRDSVDLALKIFTEKINGNTLEKERTPFVNIKEILKGKNDAYKDVKNPVNIKQGDIIENKVRVFNEGQKEALANKIKIHIPEGMGYIMNNKTNIENLWKIEKAMQPKTLSSLLNEDISEEKRKIINTEEKDPIIIEGPAVLVRDEIKVLGDSPYNLILPLKNMKDIYYLDYNISLIVLKSKSNEIIENNKNSKMLLFAEIAEIFEKDGYKDKDSIPNNLNIETFNFFQKEDDTDFEIFDINNSVVDLSLKMGVSRIYSKEGGRDDSYRRIEENLVEKEPLNISPKDEVELKIRVFNEGNIPVYAKKISIYLPDEFEYIKDNNTNINTKYKMFSMDKKAVLDESKAKILQTEILSYDNLKSIGKQQPILVSDDKNNFHYQEFSLVLRFKENLNMEEISKNIKIYSEIEEATDIYGNFVKDIDSNFGSYSIKEGNDGFKIIEDDLDYEVFKIVNFNIFSDINLESFGYIINNENGAKYIKKKLKNAKNKKIYINKKEYNNLNSLELIYKITIENKGDVEGNVIELLLSLPNFSEISRKNRIFWKSLNENEAITNDLSQIVLKPGEQKNIPLIIKINKEDLNSNIPISTNITKTYNEYGIANLNAPKNSNKEEKSNILNKIIILDISNKVFYFAIIIITILNIYLIIKILIKKNIIKFKFMKRAQNFEGKKV